MRSRSMLLVPALVLRFLGVVSALVSACVDDMNVEDMAFPCRSPADCVAEFECHPVRYVCVPVGSSLAVEPDAGPDAGAMGDR